MKSIFKMIFVILFASQAQAALKLGEKSQDLSNEHMIQQLSTYAEKADGLGFYAGQGQGWVETLLAIRCSNPAGTGRASDQVNCEYVKINRVTPTGILRLGDQTETIQNNELTHQLMNYSLGDAGLSRLVGIGQGWEVYLTLVRCASPLGTGNDSDKPSCEVLELTGN